MNEDLPWTQTYQLKIGQLQQISNQQYLLPFQLNWSVNGNIALTLLDEYNKKNNQSEFESYQGELSMRPNTQSQMLINQRSQQRATSIARRTLHLLNQASIRQQFQRLSGQITNIYNQIRINNESNVEFLKLRRQIYQDFKQFKAQIQNYPKNDGAFNDILKQNTVLKSRIKYLQDRVNVIQKKLNTYNDKLSSVQKNQNCSQKQIMQRNRQFQQKIGHKINDFKTYTDRKLIQLENKINQKFNFIQKNLKKVNQQHTMQINQLIQINDGFSLSQTKKLYIKKNFTILDKFSCRFCQKLKSQAFYKDQTNNYIKITAGEFIKKIIIPICIKKIGILNKKTLVLIMQAFLNIIHQYSKKTTKYQMDQNKIIIIVDIICQKTHTLTHNLNKNQIQKIMNSVRTQDPLSNLQLQVIQQCVFESPLMKVYEKFADLFQENIRAKVKQDYLKYMLGAFVSLNSDYLLRAITYDLWKTFRLIDNQYQKNLIRNLNGQLGELFYRYFADFTKPTQFRSVQFIE